MDWDRLPAARRIAKRDRLLVRYLREEVHPFSATEAGRLDGAGLVGGKVSSADDLGRIVPIDVSAADGLESVLRPTVAGLSASPDRFRWWWASATGRRATFVDEEIEPRFRTIHFDDHGAMVVASSAADLDRLADLGRRALGLAGVRRDDAVVTLLPARSDLTFWTVTLGCRRSGVAALHLGDAVVGTEVASYAPTVLIGTSAALRRIAAEDPEVAATVGLVLVGERLPADVRIDLADRFPGADIRVLWSPPGVRAPWVECTSGHLHTWPDAEILQTDDHEHVVWTPLGWRGTVVLRLRTDVRARLIDQPCRCGATSPRLELLEARVGASEPELASLSTSRRTTRKADHGVMADDALADAFFADDPAAALATYVGGSTPAAVDEADQPGSDDGDAAVDALPDADAVDEARPAGGSRHAPDATDGPTLDVDAHAAAGDDAPSSDEDAVDEDADGSADASGGSWPDDDGVDEGADGSGVASGGSWPDEDAVDEGADGFGVASGGSWPDDDAVDGGADGSGVASGEPWPDDDADGGRTGAGGADGSVPPVRDPGPGPRRRRRRGPIVSPNRAAAAPAPAPTPAPAGPEGRLADALDGDERVGAWFAEINGGQQLVVWIAPVVGERAALERDLPRLGARTGADRIVVDRPSSVRQRLEAAGGARVVTQP